MARIRTVKPELARHREMFEIEQAIGAPVRFAWVMLFTVCDREGRFKWRPWELKLDILPYDDTDLSRVLDAWLTRGQVVKYRVQRDWYGWIPTFRRHQVINNKEKDSSLPAIDEAEEVIDNRERAAESNQSVIDALTTREPRVNHAIATPLSNTQGEKERELERERELEGKGREQEREGEGEGTTRSPPVITIPLNTGEEFPITGLQVTEWAKLYPNVNVGQELRNMRGWCLANTTKRKTKAGVNRFINAWLAKEQDKGGGGALPAPRGSPSGLREQTMANAQRAKARLFGSEGGST